MTKIIAVIGATGSQGGGLCRALLNQTDSAYSVRAITRNPEGDKAKALAEAGAEIVCADLDDVDSLKAAFAGAYGVFGVTNYWEVFSTEREKQHAQNIALACKAANIQHIVWSTLEDTRDFIPADSDVMPILEEKYRVPHLDAKNEANAYFAHLPTTYLITSFFWDNLINFGMSPKREEDGVYRWHLPLGDTLLAGHAAEDIGKACVGLFDQPERFIDKTVGIRTAALPVADMANTISEIMGVDAKYVPVDGDTFRALPFDGAEEIGNNFQYFRDCNADFLGLRSQELMLELNPNAQSFADYVRANKDAIKAVMDYLV